MHRHGQHAQVGLHGSSVFNEFYPVFTGQRYVQENEIWFQLG
jgi:hypothetical protein